MTNSNQSTPQTNTKIRKYLITWILLSGIIFLGAGTVMILQGYQAQTDVRNNIASEKIELGTAERSDGTRDEVVAKIVPVKYQGKDLAQVGKAEALLWQREIIREHTLASTQGKVFAEMPRTIPKLDEGGNQIIGEDGKTIMIPNTARDIWTQSTLLQTALLQGYMAWRLSELVMGLGALLIFSGLAVLAISLPLSRRI